MPTSINCQYATNQIYCENKKIKKSFFGFGPRTCIEACSRNECPLKKEYKEIDLSTYWSQKRGNYENKDK